MVIVGPNRHFCGYLTTFDGSYAYSADVVQPNIGAFCSGSLRCCSGPVWKESVFCSERVKITENTKVIIRGFFNF